MNLSKAFCTRNHVLPLSKLDACGFNYDTTIQRCFPERLQIAIHNNNLSDLLAVERFLLNLPWFSCKTSSRDGCIIVEKVSCKFSQQLI